MNNNPLRLDAADVCRLLNEFLLDFLVATRSFDVYESAKREVTVKPEIENGLRRMSMSHIFVTLTKWLEIYDRYKAVMPENVQRLALELRQEIERRGVREFRNKYVGHILDRNTNRPLSANDADEFADRIVEGDPAAFLLWINNPADNAPGRTVVGTTEFVRDAIMKHFSVTNEDMYPPR